MNTTPHVNHPQLLSIDMDQEEMLFRFDNGYGAFITARDALRLAVIYYPEVDSDEWVLAGDTASREINPDMLENILERIQAMPPVDYSL